jgi:hypothetical protein
MEPKGHFWSSLPGVLTGLAALLTAGSGLYVVTRQPQAPVATPTAPAPVAAPSMAAATPQAPVKAPASDLRTAVINDPDGFVNVRTAPGANSAIAGVIKDGEIFTVTPADTAWWTVRTSGGVTGYVHKSRIVLK